MKETEITVEVFEPKQTLINKLINLGFINTKNFSMNDKYYSIIPKNRLAERCFESIIRNSFLLRKIHIENSNEDDVQLLIYKDKIFDEQGNVIAEEKVQTHIDSVDKHATIFEKSGFSPYATINSYNQIFKNGNIEFAIQDVDGLGLFIEFEEYEEIANLTPEEKIHILKETICGLGLTLGNDFNCKKLEMVLQKNDSEQSK